MSESQVNQNPQHQNSPAAGSAPAGGTPPAQATNTQKMPKPQSTSAANSAATQAGGLQFQSGQIGTQTAKQHDPFAEQKRKAAEKKAKNAKNRRIALIISGVLAGLVVIGATIAIIFVINKPAAPSAPELTSDDIMNLRNTFADVYNETSNLADVRNKYDEIMNTVIGRENSAQVNLQLLMFYINNGFAAWAVKTGEDMDPEQLSKGDQAIYYSQLYNAYINVGDSEKAYAAQYKAAMLTGEVLEEDGESEGGDTGDGDNNPDEGTNIDGAATEITDNEGVTYYVCGDQTYTFPVQCAVDGKEPDVF